jgi:hypothetical protein
MRTERRLRGSSPVARTDNIVEELGSQRRGPVTATQARRGGALA